MLRIYIYVQWIENVKIAQLKLWLVEYSCMIYSAKSTFSLLPNSPQTSSAQSLKCQNRKTFFNI